MQSSEPEKVQTLQSRLRLRSAQLLHSIHCSTPSILCCTPHIHLPLSALRHSSRLSPVDPLACTSTNFSSTLSPPRSSVMAKKKSSSDSSSPSPPTYDAATTAQANQELEQNADNSSAFKGIDLSRYRQPALVESLDRLTSFTYAGSLLLKPAFKIMWRSALYQDGEVRMQQLLSQLTGTSPVTEPRRPRVSRSRRRPRRPLAPSSTASCTFSSSASPWPSWSALPTAW